MKTKYVAWLVLLCVLMFSMGFVVGIFNQSIQPELADRFEKISDNIVPNMLEDLRAEINETEYCEVLQELECELRKEISKEDYYVEASMDSEYAPKVLIK